MTSPACGWAAFHDRIYIEALGGHREHQLSLARRHHTHPHRGSDHDHGSTSYRSSLQPAARHQEIRVLLLKLLNKLQGICLGSRCLGKTLTVDHELSSLATCRVPFMSICYSKHHMQYSAVLLWPADLQKAKPGAEVERKDVFFLRVSNAPLTPVSDACAPHMENVSP